MPYTVRLSRFEFWEADDVHLPAITVHDSDESRFSGLLDQHGRELWHQPERQPMGFCRG